MTLVINTLQKFITKPIFQAIGLESESDKSPQVARSMDPKINMTTPVISLSPSNMFWALGDNWWMQLYDGRFHQYGPEVFDKGLHGKAIEPGYYEDALKACQWVSNESQLFACPTVELYKNLHKIACRHFDGKSTLVPYELVGKFWTFDGKSCDGDPTSFFRTSLNKDQIEKKYLECNRYFLHEEAIENACAHPDSDLGYLAEIFKVSSKEELLKNLQEARSWHSALIHQFEEKRKQIELHIEQRSRALGLDRPIVHYSVELETDTVDIYYDCSTKELNQLTATLFAEYNNNMAKATSKEEKLRLIADLFQMLEWLHPFPDGQGRTDLIILMKELCRHGFTPAILERPYVSTFCTLDEWVNYLKRGMEKWQKEAARIKTVQAPVKV